MSRSGYSDDCSGWDLIKWRGAVESAIRGKRGQYFLKDLLLSLDNLSNKRLIYGELEQDGEVCALGAVGIKRGLNMSNIDPYDREGAANIFDIAPVMIAEIMYVNDDAAGYYVEEAPERRWERIRKWVVGNIR